ncbi:MAG: BrnA antitoxin family protein [Chloroflexota bacterium]|nr:BrnA antitoxin family protein [Chloroflexota bacterium]MDP9472667.1 BrnA antitoxin family protein [Chloroflexota bacterium]
MSRSQPTVDLGYPTAAQGRIPAFSSIKEEAAFWDPHDFTDFAEESQPVEVTIGPDLAERLTLRLGTRRPRGVPGDAIPPGSA